MLIERIVLAGARPLIRAASARPALALLACCLALAYPMYSLAHIRTDNSLEIWFVKGDAALQQYRDFQSTFGSDDVILVVYQRPPESEARALESRLAQELLRLRDVQAVWSPSASPQRKGYLSADGSHGALLVELTAALETGDKRVETVREIREVLDGGFAAAKVSFAMAGMSVILDAMNRVAAEDATLFLLLASLVALGSLAFSLRRLSLLVAAVAAVAASTAATMGLYVAAGKALNLISSALAPLALIIGMTGALHIGHRYLRACATARGRQAILRGVQEAAVPVVLSMLTTAVGFASLGLSRLAVVRDLGVFAAAGIAVSAPLTLVVTTAVYSLLPAPRALRGRRRALLSKLWPWLVRHRLWVLVLSALVFAGVCAGVLRLKADTYTIETFRSHHPVRRDSDYIERNFGFYTPLELVVEGAAGFWEEPRHLLAVRDLESRLLGHPEIDSAMSVVALLPPLERLSGAQQTRLVLRRLIPEQLRSRFLSRDNSKLRISTRVRMMSAAGYRRLMDQVQGLGWHLEGARLSVGGYMPLYVRMIEYVTATQISSFVLSFVVVFAILLLVAGSARLGVSAVAANLFPLGLALGFIGWAGIRLDVGTVLTAAVGIGIVVDDTIHFLHHHRSLGGDTGLALQSVGPAMLQSSVALCLGFLVLAAARMASMARFGAVSSGIILAALYGDAVLLPAMVGGRERRGGPRR